MGLLIFSVPYTLEENTKEHFPELHEWSVEKRDKWLLHNKTKDGVLQEFDNLVFHGGEGETLEMRVFCLDDILSKLKNAGFQSVKVMKEADFRHGVCWNVISSFPIIGSVLGTV